MILELEWDTRFFGFKIGKAETSTLTPDFIEKVKREKKEAGFGLVYLFADQIDEKTKEFLQNHSITADDVKVIYHKKIISENNFLGDVEEYLGAVNSKLIELALESGHKSRFKKDARLNPKFIQMYTTWITRSVNREIADTVLVIRGKNEDILGFVSIKRHAEVGVIGLIAVDSGSRGLGVGKKLMNAAENWAFLNHSNEIRVATQSDNEEACRFYLRNGYELFQTQYIFHI